MTMHSRAQLKSLLKTILKKDFLSSLLCVLMVGCAADPTITRSTTTSTTLADQSALADSLIGTKVIFNYAYFYSLTNPNPNTRCAGDTNTYFDPFVMASNAPIPFETSIADSTTTIKPSFIKNVSVDETDTNVNIATNNAYSCSYGNGTGAPPVSNCATFDYGAIGGIPSSLGGTLLIAGGLTSQYNYNGIYPPNSSFSTHGMTVSCGPVLNPNGLSSGAGFNLCPVSMYALGINVLPASAAGTSQAPGLSSATTPISMWFNLATSSVFSGPNGIAGASASYDVGLSRLLLLGGTAPLSGLGPTGYSATTYDTWVYDLKAQTWTYQSSTGVINPNMQFLWDYSAPLNFRTIQLPRSAGGRSSFGYVAASGMALSNLSSGASNLGTVCQGLGASTPGCAQVDTTDRIITIGGIGNCNGGVCTDTHRFNPTYGPEYYDINGYPSGIYPSPTPSLVPASAPEQWVESYHTQLLSNSFPNSNYYPHFPNPSPSPSPAAPFTSLGFGAVSLNNNSGSGVYTDTSSGISGSGYVLVGGGFNGYSGSSANPPSASGNVNVPQNGCSSNLYCGGTSFFVRYTFGNSYSDNFEKSTSLFGFATNFNDGGSGYENTPGQWVNLTASFNNDLMPWLGGISMQPGLYKHDNSVVAFGGSDCKYYLVGPSTQCAIGTYTSKWPTTLTNPSIYFYMGADPGGTHGSVNGFPGLSPSVIPTATPSAVPTNAGMASARGTDLNGNPMVVAWGGMSSTATPDGSNKIYYLFAGTGNTPTWGYSIPSGISPTGVGNASMVFSHVTGKYYVFGGYNPILGTRSDMWELSMSSLTPGCGSSTSLTTPCQFTWRLLSTDQGLQCYPNCPPARRSHRMVEVNYHNVSGTGEPSCPVTSPCSFGLFLEGGSPDGAANLSDRWIFDPTANGGAGLWLEASEFPPRTLAASAALDFSPTNNANTVHRTVLFGGETGMQDPSAIGMGGSGGSVQRNGSFVPPTLGDTWMYSHDSASWNRVTLYGQRYAGSSKPGTGSCQGCISETTSRASFSTSDPYTTTFAPPPISGGIMVTRTLHKKNHQTTDASDTLTIPEVYLFGGRGKDGSYQLLNQVYKFCAGSTGEKPSTVGSDDGTCDAYNVSTNPNSQSPTSNYVGAWLNKLPGGASTGTYLGAGAYDSAHDFIVAYGGLSPVTPLGSVTAKITDPTQRTISSQVLEYTPPTSSVSGASSAFHGSWNAVGVCTGSQIPTPRYGHSMGFDTFHQTLVVTGGYDINGNALLSGGMPDVWTGFRVDNELPNGNTLMNIPSLTQGTFPCYYWSPITVFGNSSSVPNLTPPSTGIAHAGSIFIPSSGYNTGFYTTFDQNCVGSGPIASTDGSINKLLVGGVYLDIDRTQLSPTENVLLNLTFLPMGPQNENSDHSQVTASESAVFKIHLISTGQSTTTLMQQLQPRNLAYSNTTRYPQIIQSLSVLSPPTGQIREEQILIPLAVNPTIDRIRVERYSGSAILINASLYRLRHP